MRLLSAAVIEVIRKVSAMHDMMSGVKFLSLKKG
jgi:hypothetical protein